MQTVWCGVRLCPYRREESGRTEGARQGLKPGVLLIARGGKLEQPAFSSLAKAVEYDWAALCTQILKHGCDAGPAGTLFEGTSSENFPRQ